MTDTVTSETIKTEILELVYGRLEAGAPAQQVTQGLFNAFGEILSHLAQPADAAAYLKREASRIERMATSPTTETKP
ncbi:MAG: hypothetical protein ACR2JJ_05035 [Sphingomicrobium sp.]